MIRKSLKNTVTSKWHIFIAVVISVLLTATQGIFAAEEISSEEIIEEQARSDEFTSLKKQLEKYSSNEAKELFEGYDPQSILKDVSSGNFKFNFTGLLGRMANYFFKEIYLNIHILIKLAILVILCALLKNLQTSFLSESVGGLAFYVCYIVVVSIMILSFTSAMKLGIDIIDKMVGFMYSTLPILITLLVSGGNITSGGIFQPVLVMVTEVIATIIKNVFIPVILLSTILTIVSNISEKIQVSKLADLMKKTVGVVLGLILTAFVAVVSVQGSIGAVIDGVASKTAKYAIGAFIPVVGGYLADAADTVIGCTLLIKNAAGVAVMIGIAAICIVPMIKIAALVVLYKATCALIQPISEKRITECISGISDSLVYILGIVGAVAFMFLMSVTAIIGASNISTMVR
ncbi:MAG TPA: stage III sporulation protein AE [Clostridiaceae bacterium]|nr:stage III sporulation protein AE [Clostridiaceae bacterium]